MTTKIQQVQKLLKSEIVSKRTVRVSVLKECAEILSTLTSDVSQKTMRLLQKDISRCTKEEVPPRLSQVKKAFDLISNLNSDAKRKVLKKKVQQKAA